MKKKVGPWILTPSLVGKGKKNRGRDSVGARGEVRIYISIPLPLLLLLPPSYEEAIGRRDDYDFDFGTATGPSQKKNIVVAWYSEKCLPGL